MRTNDNMIPLFTSSINRRHFKTFIIRNTIVITMMRRIMSGLLRPYPILPSPLILKSLVLILWPVLLLIIRWLGLYYLYGVIYCVGGLTVSGPRAQFCWVPGINCVGNWTLLGKRGEMKSGARNQWQSDIYCCSWWVSLWYQKSHGDQMFAGFVAFQRVEAR